MYCNLKQDSYIHVIPNFGLNNDKVLYSLKNLSCTALSVSAVGLTAEQELRYWTFKTQKLEPGFSFLLLSVTHENLNNDENNDIVQT